MKRHTPVGSLSRSRSRGFTLLEVLIAVVVLSIGLLGLAGLQATGLRNNHSAYLRSQATMLAHDIFERMRANRQTVLSAALPYNTGLDNSAAGTGIVLQDLTDWKAVLAVTLPSGKGAVTCIAATTTCTVTIQWDDSRGVSGSTAQQFSETTDL